MDGEAAGEGWGDDDDEDENSSAQAAGDEGKERKEGEESGRGRAGRWESGKDRCAVTGRRVLGGTEGLRRVMV